MTAYDEAAATLTYLCRHGHDGSMSLADGERISGKLVWKVDWPMRWAHEGVSFEPAGEDHHAPTGSFTVGRTLVRDVFGGEPPQSTVYSFVSLAGLGGKLSGSAGGAPVPADALELLEPAIMRWLYIRRLPSQGFAIDLTAKGVQKLYDEWDRFVAAALAPDAAASDAAMYGSAVRTSAGDVVATPRRVSFRLLAAAADLTQGNREQIVRIVSQHLDEPVTLDELEPRLSCATELRRAAAARAAHLAARVVRRGDVGVTGPRHPRGRRDPRRRARRRLVARRPDDARLRGPEGHARRPARHRPDARAQVRPADVLQGALPAACARATRARACRRSCSRSAPSAPANCSSATAPEPRRGRFAAHAAA